MNAHELIAAAAAATDHDTQTRLSADAHVACAELHKNAVFHHLSPTTSRATAWEATDEANAATGELNADLDNTQAAADLVGRTQTRVEAAQAHALAVEAHAQAADRLRASLR